jgi:hypothetical protein
MDSNPWQSAVGCLLLVLTLAGCLPSSCRRVESRAISPADSLSRQIAEQMTPDTLALVWRASGPDDRELGHPRTVRFGPNGGLFVSDVARNSVYTFSATGAFVAETTWEGVAFPYLVGLRGDTMLVFNPEAHRLDFVVQGVVLRRLSTPGDLPRGALQYVTATDEAIYVKVVAKDAAGYVVRLDEQGRVQARVPLAGPHWRHAGLLRVWDDMLLSLSGFRPVIDVLDADLNEPLDTLALVGFDSPMLRRTFAFMRGDTYEAPLLSSSSCSTCVPAGCASTSMTERDACSTCSSSPTPPTIKTFTRSIWPYGWPRRGATRSPSRWSSPSRRSSSIDGRRRRDKGAKPHAKHRAVGTAFRASRATSPCSNRSVDRWMDEDSRTVGRSIDSNRISVA